MAALADLFHREKALVVVDHAPGPGILEVVHDVDADGVGYDVAGQDGHGRGVGEESEVVGVEHEELAYEIGVIAGGPRSRGGALEIEELQGYGQEREADRHVLLPVDFFLQDALVDLHGVHQAAHNYDAGAHDDHGHHDGDGQQVHQRGGGDDHGGADPGWDDIKEFFGEGDAQERGLPLGLEPVPLPEDHQEDAENAGEGRGVDHVLYVVHGRVAGRRVKEVFGRYPGDDIGGEIAQGQLQQPFGGAVVRFLRKNRSQRFEHKFTGAVLPRLPTVLL